MGKHNLYDRYTPTLCGKLFDNIKKKYVKLHKSKNGYIICNLKINNKWSAFYMHRIVCGYYKKNTLNKDTVNHIDGNKENNHIGNLEWMSLKENLQHAFNTGLKNNKHSMKKVKNTLTGEVYIGVHEASVKSGISINILYKALSGDRQNKTNLTYG